MKKWYWQHVSIYVYMSIAYSDLKKKSRFSVSSRYHLQLHWSCWRAVPVHLGLWPHGTWCQYHCCMCMYDYCLFHLEKRRFSLFQLQILSAAALKLLTSCSSTPWVMNAWILMSILLLCVYICLLPILLFQKKQIFIVLAADTICSCIEAVDEQFQYILDSECM